MPDVETWQERDPKHYRQAYDLLMMEQPKERVIEQIIRAGMSDKDAADLVAEAWRSGRGDRRGEGRTEIMRGVTLLLVGLVMTLFFSINVGPLAIRFIFGGAILYGLFDLIRGARKLSS